MTSFAPSVALSVASILALLACNEPVIPCDTAKGTGAGGAGGGRRLD